MFQTSATSALTPGIRIHILSPVPLHLLGVFPTGGLDDCSNGFDWLRDDAMRCPFRQRSMDDALGPVSTPSLAVRHTTLFMFKEQRMFLTKVALIEQTVRF